MKMKKLEKFGWERNRDSVWWHVKILLPWNVYRHVFPDALWAPRFLIWKFFWASKIFLRITGPEILSYVLIDRIR